MRAAVESPVEQQPVAEKPRRKVQAVAIHESQAVAPVNPMTVVERAIEKGITGQDLKELMDLQERWEANQARKAFDVAMANAQAEMPTIVKNRLVDFATSKGRTTYRHEDLAEVVETIKPVLHKHGLAHRFRTEQFQRGEKPIVKVTCIITGHGHREETSLEAGPDSNGSNMNDIQRIQSAVTYLERGTLKAALGLAASIDDDGRGTEDTGGTITAIQLQELEKLAAEVGADITKACKHLKIETLANLPAARFERAKASLEAKRAPL